MKEIVKCIIVFLQTPILSLQIKCQEILENIEKNEKAILERVSSSLGIPSSPSAMLNSMMSSNPFLAKKTAQTPSLMNSHKFQSASATKRRTSFSNESTMKMYNLDKIPPNSTTNKALALKDYLPLLKNTEKRNSEEWKTKNENQSVRRKDSIPSLFSPKIRSTASRFKDFSNVNETKKIECQRYLEIYK